MDQDIIQEFVSESKDIVRHCLEILEELEGHPDLASRLEAYGNNIDRIMGGAQTIALDVSRTHFLNLVSEYSAICKAVGYKTAQIKNDPAFFDVCIALLIDATEMLSVMLDKSNLKIESLKEVIPEEFIGRLNWALSQFKDDLRATVDIKPQKKKPFSK